MCEGVSAVCRWGVPEGRALEKARSYVWSWWGEREDEHRLNGGHGWGWW